MVVMVVEESEVAGIENGNTKVTGQSDAELDLRGVICPDNFVKTKLKLETYGTGTSSFSAVGRWRPDSECPFQREQ